MSTSTQEVAWAVALKIRNNQDHDELAHRVKVTLTVGNSRNEMEAE